MMRLTISLIALLGLAACNGGPNKTNIEIVQNMMDQPSIKSQDWVPADGDKEQMLMPPAHTISRGHPPYPYADDPGGAEKQVNPFAGNSSPEVMAVGHKYFDIYCSICHGKTGAGDGNVAVKMAVKPRNLLGADAKSYTDGRIFHAISAGRGVMRPYISQIPDPEIRWKIVTYVRSLQRQ
jgi:mono/diheme cytochrome c family protein